MRGVLQLLNQTLLRREQLLDDLVVVLASILLPYLLRQLVVLLLLTLKLLCQDLDALHQVGLSCGQVWVLRLVPAALLLHAGRGQWERIGNHSSGRGLLTLVGLDLERILSL